MPNLGRGTVGILEVICLNIKYMKKKNPGDLYNAFKNKVAKKVIKKVPAKKAIQVLI